MYYILHHFIHCDIYLIAFFFSVFENREVKFVILSAMSISNLKLFIAVTEKTL